MADLEKFRDMQVQANVGNIVQALAILNDTEFRMWADLCKSYPNFNPAHFQGAEATALCSNPWVFPRRDGATENRVQEAIDALQQRIATLSPQLIEVLTKSTEVSYAELRRFQEIQRAAFANGLLMAAEATQLHYLYGEEAPSPQGFAEHTLAERIVAIRVVGELVRRLAMQQHDEGAFT